MIQERLAAVQECIKRAAERSRRNVNDIELVLVSKEVEPARIEEAYRLGIRDFGENRAQEFLAKVEDIFLVAFCAP